MLLKNNRWRKPWVYWGVVGCILLIIIILSYLPETVERYYARGLYPGIGSLLRLLTGWLPFSLGDIGYALLFLFLLFRLVRSLIRLAGKRNGPKALSAGLLRVVRVIVLVYIVFKLMWGLNYDRAGIAYQLGIQPKPYDKASVARLTDELIDTLNTLRRQLPDSLPAPALQDMFRDAEADYRKAAQRYPFLRYDHPSIKGSLYSQWADYLGFTGYYNPLTGEAQVRTDIPRVLIPYICTHEMAHQLGYASESEANFVGYLAASVSDRVYTRYSLYLDLFSYAQGQEILLFGQDTSFHAFETLMHHNRERLDTLVKLDRKQIREFFRIRANRMAPAVTSLYDQYLKLNRQMAGVNSYDEVIGWLMAYREKMKMKNRSVSGDHAIGGMKIEKS